MYSLSNLLNSLHPSLAHLWVTHYHISETSKHFVYLIKYIQSEETFVSYNVESLFTNVPVGEALEIIRMKEVIISILV